MDNLKLPAYPLPFQKGPNGFVDAIEYSPANGGFTKLELASLMIAQGILSSGRKPEIDNFILPIQEAAVKIAKAVLEEANK